ncbi:MAG: DUF3299 domain-containing protein [Deltaproteobacteria bacterium]|jgi:hypothetical protein|nr:DUF3299 domain-containing protein [Deltaproteobacteria bacterium]
MARRLIMLALLVVLFVPLAAARRGAGTGASAASGSPAAAGGGSPPGFNYLDRTASGDAGPGRRGGRAAPVSGVRGKARLLGDPAGGTGGADAAGDDDVSSSSDKAGPAGSAETADAGTGASGDGSSDVFSGFGDEPRPEPKRGPGGYLENGWLIWDELMPAGWDPAEIFEELKINEMADDDPRVEQVIEAFLKKWEESPVNLEADGDKMKIPGFVVPLDFNQDEVAEFFLVPFFGACIHVPPPPPNQIVMVRLKKPLRGLGAMEVVWVFGQLSVEHVSTDMGSAGYSLAADKVEFYQFDPDQG